MPDEKNPLITEVVAAFHQIFDELADRKEPQEGRGRRGARISDEHAWTLATWCVAAKDPEGAAFQNPPVFGKQPTRVPVPVATR